MRFNYSRLVPTRTPSADEVVTHEMGGLPLSMVVLNIQPLNDTGTLANFNEYLSLCAAFNRISILHRGEQIFGMRGEDAGALAWFRHGIKAYQGQLDNTNDERRSLSLPLLLGRSPFHPTSCFPEIKRGGMTLELDIDIADTGYDGLRYSVDILELPEAKPKEFEKKVQLNKTFAATGDQDFDLPINNLFRGALLWGTTGFAGASPAPSWGTLRVLLDNQENGFSSIPFEVLQMWYSLWGSRGFVSPNWEAHKHIVTTDGNAQTELATLAGVYNSGNLWDNYAWLDYDPTGDDLFALDTAGANAFKIRSNVGTADAVRCIPIERIVV